MGRLRVGTSGYQYAHWRGLFYPPGLPKRRWFEHYARHFDSVEVNNTFYRLPAEDVFDEWYLQAPDGFLYTLKFSRYGSHRKRLKDPESSIGRFLGGAGRLKEALGPILVQLPPRWRPNPPRLEAFLAAAPARHRWAIEVRDPRWLCEEIFAVLERHQAALCIHDLIPGHPRRLTAGWLYLRFHGTSAPAGNYTARFLKEEAARIRDALQAGHDVYAYFNNDPHGHAVRNAMELKALVGE